MSVVSFNPCFDSLTHQKLPKHKRGRMRTKEKGSYVGVTHRRDPSSHMTPPLFLFFLFA